MTKRKAIEAAMERWVEARRHRVAVDIEDVIAGSCVEKAYELGLIAGLREASRWVESERIDRSDGTYVLLTGLSRAIRTYANMLAKKARSK